MKQQTQITNKWVLEGAHPDSVSNLQYYVASLEIPPNAALIKIGKTRLTLHARISDFSQPECVVPHYTDRSKIKGWDLNGTEEEQHLPWVFEMPRALIGHDGRFYLNEVIYKPGFSYYLHFLPKVIEDSAHFFTGQLTEQALLGLARRMF